VKTQQTNKYACIHVKEIFERIEGEKKEKKEAYRGSMDGDKIGRCSLFSFFSSARLDGMDSENGIGERENSFALPLIQTKSLHSDSTVHGPRLSVCAFSVPFAI